MGLGPLALYGRADALTQALEAKRKRHDGIDPIAARRAGPAATRSSQGDKPWSCWHGPNAGRVVLPTLPL